MSARRRVTFYRGSGGTTLDPTETKGWYAAIYYEEDDSWHEEVTLGPFDSREEAIRITGPRRPIKIPPESAGAFTVAL